jgi:hypothetical protein
MKNTFAMSAAAAALAMLAGGCVDPAPSPRPDSVDASGSPIGTATPDPFCRNQPSQERVVTITYSGGSRRTCRNNGASPEPVVACQGDRIRWDFSNACDHPIEASLRLKAEGNPLEDRVGEVRPDPHPVPPATGGAAGHAYLAGKVHPSAPTGRYKYDIGGTYPLDPEIDVRRSGG